MTESEKKPEAADLYAPKADDDIAEGESCVAQADEPVTNEVMPEMGCVRMDQVGLTFYYIKRGQIYFLFESDAPHRNGMAIWHSKAGDWMMALLNEDPDKKPEEWTAVSVAMADTPQFAEGKLPIELHALGQGDKRIRNEALDASKLTGFIGDDEAIEAAMEVADKLSDIPEAEPKAQYDDEFMEVDWPTDEQLPKPRFKPMVDYILVVQTTEERVTAGGILMPENSFHRNQKREGFVIATGPGRITSDGQLVECGVKRGDYVYMARVGGHEVDVDGRAYLAVRPVDIMGTKMRPDEDWTPHKPATVQRNITGDNH